MGPLNDPDGQFHRAVDIVQSLPKGGPVQTSYEEKLWLYSLYKQATEGDISIPRPGMLDILGKAKWDAWNKQKGIDKKEAKRLYVTALLKILRKHGDSEGSQGHIAELESFVGVQGSTLSLPPRPVSPASSTSSYHSSQASPPSQPSPPKYPLLPPDPLLPPPDVAEDIVPPSALTSSHRSLLSLSQANNIPPIEGNYGGISLGAPHVASRTHSLAGGGRNSTHGERPNITGGSIHSFRQRTNESNYQGQMRNPGAASGLPFSRDFINVQQQQRTPEMSSSPYLGLNVPTPIYPNRPGPGSNSTFAQAPINIPLVLQNIQTSLTALHERLSTLERTQAMILRKDERKKGWFWGSTEEDELDQLEDENDNINGNVNRNGNNRSRTRSSESHITVTRVKRRKGKLSARLMWYILTAVRRALVDVGVGLLVTIAGIIVLGGGWRRARWTLGILQARFQRYLTEGLK
ncbi:uncharacterized protein IL334_004804 [Kwoniella shivajii]|uniref:ACB domain-containing protein n=1 Tax=Kwoniella shivajii TaxID=564305 RepID=A0ABZ1D1Q9_9TREE|nr:hypothetical protein IL334_004804 [Kwoniella shivajii]